MSGTHNTNNFVSNDFSRLAIKYSGRPLVILALLSSYTSGEESFFLRSQQAIKDCIMSGFVRGRALSYDPPKPQLSNRRRVAQQADDQATTEASTDNTSTHDYPQEELRLENQPLDATNFVQSLLSHSRTRLLNNSRALPHFVTGDIISPALYTSVGPTYINTPTTFPGHVPAAPSQSEKASIDPTPAPSSVLHTNGKGGKPKWTDLERESIVHEWFLDDASFQMIVPILLRQSTEKAAIEKLLAEEVPSDTPKADTLADKYKRVLSNEHVMQATRNHKSVTSQIITLVETVNDMSAKHAPGVNHLRAKVEDVAYYVRLNLGTALASTSSGAIHRFSKSNLGPWFDQGENSFFNLILKRLQGQSKVINGTQGSLLNPVRGQSQTSARSTQVQAPTSTLNPSSAARSTRTTHVAPAARATHIAPASCAATVARNMPTVRNAPIARAIHPMAAKFTTSPTTPSPPISGATASSALNLGDSLTGYFASATTLAPPTPGYADSVCPSISHSTPVPSASPSSLDPMLPESAEFTGFNPMVLEAPMSPPLSYSRSSVGYSAGRPEGQFTNDPSPPREPVILKPELLPSSVEAMRLAIKMAEIYARLADDKGGSMMIYAKSQAVLANCRRAEVFLDIMQKSWNAAFADSRLREAQAQQAISVADRLCKIGTPEAIASATELYMSAGTNLNTLAASKETTLGHIAPMALNACGPTVVADPNDIARDSEILSQLLTQVGEFTKYGTEESISAMGAPVTSLDTIQMSHEYMHTGGATYNF
ncbi:hypothetical protein RSOLAG1IB_08490 [Rhizoctonia solani AG-1 IB]|uniref:Uncharacterized protein n=1 Tax=Thanatephorus cucumeris (strain AG1-IB / isolate 7/3/14) TaxID=1108050 RepID=M5CCV8_THACB|nr:hypothetical protein BN14_07757 [Rhizoctonia solani AG-1 IB]CEL57278.1 hypothetical protein RSOLAG1IB_08490 [Rhizoctonia solani AG-1 IB]